MTDHMPAMPDQPLGAPAATPASPPPAGDPVPPPLEAQAAPAATAPSERDPLGALQAWLRYLTSVGGSDLHVKAGAPPRVRVEGVLQPMDGPQLTAEQTEVVATAVIPSFRTKRFEDHGEVDFAYAVEGLGRFRAHVFRQRGSCTLVFRRLTVGGQPFAEIGLPPVVKALSEEPRGLVLVTGPTGSGKTTTLAAMIEHINRTKPVHIVTIEDPIEIIHPDRMASVAQREVGQDTDSFLAAIRAALRADPDVILIGEMRDSETVQAGLRAAETGHLVLSTLHTLDATETVNRVVDFFPSTEQNQVRITLAAALRGIVSQRLIVAGSGGRIPAVEILVNTGRVAERIIDRDLTAEIPEVIRDGGYYGMQTFDQSLLSLVKAGTVSVEEAMRAASQPHDFQLMLQQVGLVPAGLL
jgi:twitching motility protein PilT